MRGEIFTYAPVTGSTIKSAIFINDEVYLHKCNSCNKVFYENQTFKRLEESKL